MGMFDHYEPDPALSCPACGAKLGGWQGKDGPCALFVWRQGVPGPIGQEVPEESRATDAFVQSVRLPDSFEIYTQCCGGGFFITARCVAPRGVWSRSELETAETARQLPQERAGEFRRRLEWLRGADSKDSAGPSQ